MTGTGLAFLDAFAFDSGGPAEVTLSAPGDLVQGVARHSLEGCFLVFQEFARSVLDWWTAMYPEAARLR